MSKRSITLCKIIVQLMIITKTIYATICGLRSGGLKSGGLMSGGLKSAHLDEWLAIVPTWLPYKHT